MGQPLDVARRVSGSGLCLLLCTPVWPWLVCYISEVQHGTVAVGQPLDVARRVSGSGFCLLLGT